MLAQKIIAVTSMPTYIHSGDGYSVMAIDLEGYSPNQRNDYKLELYAHAAKLSNILFNQLVSHNFVNMFDIKILDFLKYTLEEGFKNCFDSGYDYFRQVQTPLRLKPLLIFVEYGESRHYKNEYFIAVHDNGHGLRASKTLEKSRDPGHYLGGMGQGLCLMSEKAVELNGILEESQIELELRSRSIGAELDIRFIKRKS